MDLSLRWLTPSSSDQKQRKNLCSWVKLKNIVRLGAFHGIDDPYYVKKFAAQFWSQPNGKTYTEPLIDIEIGMGGLTPTSDSEFF